MVLKFVAHSKTVIEIAARHGWKPAARYTNLRDVKTFDRLGFLDIEWKHYDFDTHLNITKQVCPLMTVAKDIEHPEEVGQIIDQAFELQQYATYVVIVPKHPKLGPHIEDLVPTNFILGFSVPTRYGGSRIPPEYFKRAVHLLGGRPDVQRRLAKHLNVFSLDCNRFTYDARYGDYFDGNIFRPHPEGGYFKCIEDSIKNINKLWENGRTTGSRSERNSSQLCMF